LISITRLLAKQLKLIVKKALKAPRPPDLEIVTSSTGLRIRTQFDDRAVEYARAGALPKASIIVPYKLLEDVAGSRPDEVRLSAPKKGTVIATWPDGDSSHRHEYKVTVPKKPPEFPETPTKFTRQPANLLTALAHANEVTDPSSSRYALGCIQLDGAKKQIAATDGRQMLLQRIADLGIDGELLVYGSDIFTCPALPESAPVSVGHTAKHFVLRVGAWSFYLPINKEGRFPRVDAIVPNWQSAKTSLTIPASDGAFLTANAKQLPAEGTPVCTFDLNGSVALRAKTLTTPHATEIVLTNSQKTGEDVRIGIDRRNLLTALRFGFKDFHLFGPQAALLARDESRSYVWMPMEDPALVRPTGTCIRVESPPSHTRPYQPIPSTPTTMPRIAPTTTPAPTQTAPSAQPAKQRRTRTKSAGTTLDQAVAVRDQLRTSLAATKELIRSLKGEKRQHRLLKSTLASLKTLQQVA
jgi:hypothetical protein